MYLESLGRVWNRLGEVDPMWAVLMDPQRTGNRWDPNEFYQTGFADVCHIMHQIRWMHFPLRRGRALDFGCGLGRLTQSLARYFDVADAVDIAPAMIYKAQGYNPYGDRCRFHCNEREDLKLFGDKRFDFILSLLVLQHMQPTFAKNYIAEFMRVLAPGGLLVFQQPSHFNQIPTAEEEPQVGLFRRQMHRVWRKVMGDPEALASVDGPEDFDYPQIAVEKYERLAPVVDKVASFRRTDAGTAGNPMAKHGPVTLTSAETTPATEIHVIPKPKMMLFLRRLGGRVIHVDHRSDSTQNYTSFRYFVTK